MKGELYQPLVILPPVMVAVEPDILMTKKGIADRDRLVVNITDNRSDTTTKINIVRGEEKNTGNMNAVAELSVNGQKRSYSQNLHRIAYDHIPDISYFRQDVVKVLNMDLKIAGKKIGYIEGAGDKLPGDLALMGYDVTVLKEKDIVQAFLHQFDAVITGIRAYNVHGWLSEKNRVLNEYISQGGNLIVQYNTNSFAGPNRATIGPLPFQISRERVTDEGSPVKLLLPDHIVFNFPNRITQKDFTNWIQERGVYFADKLHTSFVTPLALKDPGEEEMNGSLVIAPYGKGVFVYTGLAFFRQLPAAVPGAYRLLANIIALNKSKPNK